MSSMTVVIERTIFHNWTTKDKCLGYRYWSVAYSEFDDTWAALPADDIQFLAKICMQNTDTHEQILAAIEKGWGFKIDQMQYTAMEIEKVLANCALLSV